MANRLKEDEKNERIIRGLLKLPENRRCINCNSLGPQYVCINFWTFVCTACSGIHREFTHRVKSISMAKFTSQEVSALQEGGNQRAKEIYFKEWDPQRQSFPDSSNVERLRDFIKHVYVDRRYTGDRSYDKPPRVKMGDKEEFYENRSQGGSRSPPYEDTYERRYSDRSSPGGRSPGYEQDNRQYGDYRRSPARPEVVNDWRRDDRFGNGRKFGDRRDGESKVEGRSPERLQDMGSSSPPVVRPVREILGENVVPLRISEPPKANGGRTSETSAQTQRTASSSSLGSTNGNPPEVKLESTVSLIDFDTDPEPPPAAGVAKTQQTTAAQTVVQPTISANDNNWASFDFPPDPKVSHPPSNVNTLDSVLSELSVPATVPGHTSGVPSGPGISMAASMGNLTVLPDPAVAPVGHTPMLPTNVGALAVSPGSSFSTFPPGGAIASNPAVAPAPPTSAGHFLVKATDQGQWPSVQHQQCSFFPAAGNPSATQQFTPPLDGSASNQPWNTSLPPNVHGFLSTPAAQAVSIPVKEVTSGGAQPSSMEVKPTGRKELPEDLFATTYQFFPASVPGWHTGPPRGMGFSMQYNAAAVPLQSQPLPNFPQPSKSTNPFDLSSEPPQNQTFPSMLPLQSALPSVPSSSGLLRTSSLGTPSPAWMPPQSLVYPGMPSQAPFHPSAVPPRYMGPPVASNMPPSSHQLGSIGNEGPPFGFVNTDQQLAGRFSASVARHPFSSAGGNPFG